MLKLIIGAAVRATFSRKLGSLLLCDVHVKASLTATVWVFLTFIKCKDQFLAAPWQNESMLWQEFFRACLSFWVEFCLNILTIKIHTIYRRSLLAVLRLPVFIIDVYRLFARPSWNEVVCNSQVVCCLYRTPFRSLGMVY